MSADRGLLERAREIRRAAHVPADILAVQLGMPVGLLRAWETSTPDLGRLSRRDQLAAERWAAILTALEAR